MAEKGRFELQVENENWYNYIKRSTNKYHNFSGLCYFVIIGDNLVVAWWWQGRLLWDVAV